MKSSTRSYKDLVVWQKGIELAKLTYRLTQRFPAEEKFGLVTQMRRAAVLIPSNIAEGQARHTTGEFIQLISHAEESVAELGTQLILAVELGLCSEEPARARSTCWNSFARCCTCCVVRSARAAKLGNRHPSLVTRH